MMYIFWYKFYFSCIQYKDMYSAWGIFFLLSFFEKKKLKKNQLNCSTSSDEMRSKNDYEIWILPQELQSVDINLQSFWSNWCSAEEQCNTSCCDVPCILFSTVSGHACHSPSARPCGHHLVTLCCEFSETEQRETPKNSDCQQKNV